MSGSTGLPVDDARLSSSPSPSQALDSSPPRAHSRYSSGSLSAGPTILHPRPLPSLKPTQPLLQYTQEAGIADDRASSADLPPQSPANAGTRRPRASLDEGDRTSSGFSDSELLYASAPSSPLRVSAEYNSENDSATPVRQGAVRREPLKRHAAEDFGTGHFHPSELYKLSSMMGESEDGDSTRPPTATQTPLDRWNRRLSASSAASPVSIGLSGGNKTFVDTVPMFSSDGPDFPIPDVQLNPSNFQDTPHPLPTSRSQNSREEPAKFAAFSSADHSSSPQDVQVQDSIFPSIPEPRVLPLIPGTNLQFEPLHHRSATFPQPSTNSSIPNAGSSYFNTHRPLPSLPSYSPSRYVQGFKGTGVPSSKSFGFSKHPRSSPYLRIPSGAAAPTPPGSMSSTDLPMCKSPDSAITSSGLVSPSSPSDKNKDADPPESHVATVGLNTNMVAKPERRPVRVLAPNRNINQIAPAPGASVQQAKHVHSEKAANPSATTSRDHQNDKVMVSSHALVSPKLAVNSNVQRKEDPHHRLGAKTLRRGWDDIQTTQIQSQDPTANPGTTSRPLEHRIASQPNKLSFPPELPSPEKSSSSPNDGSTVPLNDLPSMWMHTLAEDKAQYSKIPPSSRSQYMNMLLALDDIPTIYDLAASFSTWILLAGFVLFPGTFTSLETLNLGNGFGASLVNRIVNLPVFIVAFVCTGIGIIGMIYLWWRWMKNYIWLVNKIFLPGLMNALAGVISTIVNVYGVQHGEFNTTSIITISVTAGTGLVLGLLTLWYGVFLLGLVKGRHVKEMEIEKAGKHGERVYSGFGTEVEK